MIPRRWVVERSLAWLTSHRRLARDYEHDPAVSEAMVRWAAIGQMARRLNRGRDRSSACLDEPGPHFLTLLTRSKCGWSTTEL